MTILIPAENKDMNSFGENIRSHIRISDTLQRLLAINIVVFLIIRIVNATSGLFLNPMLSFGDITAYLALPANLSKLMIRPWTIFSYMFLHWDIMHIFFNMLWLYWMGKIFQEYLGSKKLLSTYLAGGFVGGLFFIAAYNIFPLFRDSLPGAFALGASASVLAVTVAAATLLPEYPIQLIFFGTVPLKWIAVITIILDLINISGNNAGGHIAHLGGACYGFVYIRSLQKGSDLTGWLTRIFDRFSTSRKMKVAYRNKKNDEEYNVTRKAKQERMDDILDKISKSGYGSLTQEEKDFLFKMSKEN
jgi:membrane associated rhomboid family serine protease